MTEYHSVQNVTVKRSVETSVRDNEHDGKFFWNSVSICVSGPRYQQLAEIRKQFDQWSTGTLLEEIIYEGLNNLFAMAMMSKEHDEEVGQ